MKERVRIDSLLAATAAIFFTAFLYLFPSLFSTSHQLDNALDFLGLIIVLEGNVLRMAARGHKKANSNKSNQLVTRGPYTLVRNPMYLGSFLIGIGFILIAWPWWTLPIFALLFYLRFKKQIVKEEAFLNTAFGNEYKNYCSKTPRFFPSFKILSNAQPREILNGQELMSTKEKWGLIVWPILAVVLESIQETVIFGHTNILQTILIFVSAMVFYAISFRLVFLQTSPMKKDNA